MGGFLTQQLEALGLELVIQKWALSPVTNERWAMEGIDKQVLTPWLCGFSVGMLMPKYPLFLLIFGKNPPNPSGHVALDSSTCFCFTS